MARQGGRHKISVTRHCARRWWERTAMAPSEMARYLNDPRGKISDCPPDWAPLRRGGRRFLVVHRDQICFLLERSQLAGYQYAAITCVVRKDSKVARVAAEQHMTGSSAIRRRITYTTGRRRDDFAIALGAVIVAAVVIAAYASAYA